MISFRLNGAPVEVADDGGSLLDVLREELGQYAAKDGCSPQGQCGCCTVWVDDAPRVACVTPVRRVSGRSVTTLEGLGQDVSGRWADAFTRVGASQCGFCTPGIVMRLAGLEAQATGPVGETQVRGALLAHLCRCTGWQTVVEAAGWAMGEAPAPGAGRRPGPRRLAGRARGRPGPVRGPGRGPRWRGLRRRPRPRQALVAVPAPEGGYVVADSLGNARRASGKIQGRRSPTALVHPLALPEGDWALTLRTTWVEPAYLEPDASWCRPGEGPASPLANGGAFGGKRRSPVPVEAEALAERHGRPVRVLWSREDVVRRGPKRPPVALGIDLDGGGVLRLAWPATSAPPKAMLTAIGTVAPGLRVELVAVAGPPVSADLRAAGWAEAAAAQAALGVLRQGSPWPDAVAEVTSPSGGRARVGLDPGGEVHVEVWAGAPLDPVTLRSYCIGAVHQALGWVWREGIAVDAAGEVLDLTVRSFGILTARDTPRVHVAIQESDTTPVNGSDAVFAATAAAAWLAEGLPGAWPTRRGRPPRPAVATAGDGPPTVSPVS